MRASAPRKIWLVWSELDGDWSTLHFSQRKAKDAAAEREDCGYGKHVVVPYERAKAAAKGGVK